MISGRANGFPASASHEILNRQGRGHPHQFFALFGGTPVHGAAFEMTSPGRILAVHGAFEDAAEKRGLEGLPIASAE